MRTEGLKGALPATLIIALLIASCIAFVSELDARCFGSALSSDNEEPWITSIKVEPSSATLKARDFEYFYAIATYSDGENEYVTSVAQWTVDPPSAGSICMVYWLSVEPPFCAAWFRAENVGNATVTASYEGHSDNASVTVLPENFPENFGLADYLRSNQIDVTSIEITQPTPPYIELTISFASDLDPAKVENTLREALHVLKLAYTYLFDNSDGNLKPSFEPGLANLSKLRAQANNSTGEGLCCGSLDPILFKGENNDRRNSLLNEELFWEGSYIKWVVGPKPKSVSPPENRLKGIELLLLISPQYSQSPEIIDAVNFYRSAVKADINWDSETILLNDNTNSIGHIREIIRNKYQTDGIYATLIIGEDTKTMLRADYLSQDSPSIAPWSVLNERMKIVWRKENESILIWLEWSSTILPQQLDFFSVGSQPVMIGYTPNVAVSLLYPTSTFDYCSKVSQITNALIKFSENRRRPYDDQIFFFINTDFHSTAFVENYRRIGSVHWDSSEADIDQLNGKELKLLGSFGHGNPRWAHGLAVSEVEEIDLPFLSVGGCYTSGWYTDYTRVENQFDPPTVPGWFGEEALLHPSLRTIIAGSPLNRSSGSGAVKNFMWYGWKELSENKTIAEAWLGTSQSEPPKVYVDGQLIYGDPTFHYGNFKVKHDPIYIDGNAGFTPENGVNGGGSGTENDPYIIENWDISAETATGIEIRNTTAHFVVRNCVVKNGRGTYHYGIYLYNVVNGRIENNTCENNYGGIHLYSSSNNTMANNTCENNSYGISPSSSSNNTISNNTCSNNSYGIYLDQSDNNALINNTCSNNSGIGIYLMRSDNNTVTSNTCENNHYDSIALCSSSNNLISNNIAGNSWFGIGLASTIGYFSDNNTLDNNTCSNNRSGIWLSSIIIVTLAAHNNTLTNNTCENNSEFGIWVGTNNGNHIYHNNLINNENQAYDNDTNYWDDGYPSGGNYWSDYTGVDENHGENQNIPGSDGIGDTPYYIPGDNNRDRYPLMNPWSVGLADTPWPKFKHDAQNTGRSSAPSISQPMLKWSYTTSGEIHSSPAIAPDGTVYVGSHDGNLYALNQDGTLKWSYATGDCIYSSPAIASDGTVYFGSVDGKLYALNPDGTLKWSYAASSIFSSPAIASDGTIYVGSNDYKLYSLKPDGSLKWSSTISHQVISSPAIALDGTIYVGQQDSWLYALNPDGTVKWRYFTGGSVRSSPAIASDGTVYVGSLGRKLYAFNPDGTLKWSYTTGGGDSSPAIAADGTVYIGSWDGKLYAIKGPTPRPPILIIGNDNFTSANGVTLGSGTESDPYIIENWDISAENAHGIEIRDTTDYFVIRNCVVENGGYSYSGIYLDNVVHGRIDNNTYSNNSSGIYLYYSDNNLVTNNLVENNRYGITLASSDNNILSSNIVENTLYYGIHLYSSDNNLISNNIVGNNDYAGIHLRYSDNNLVSNNLVGNNGNGIYLYRSSNNLISNNIVENTLYHGVYLDFDSDNNLLSNNLVENNRYGISLYLSDYCNISNNLVENNYIYGISLYLSDYCNISNNLVGNNGYGIYLRVLSNNNTLSNNTCENNNYGIYLWGSDNSHISNNLVENNGTGIRLRYSSDNNLINHNNFINNENQAYDDGSNFWDNGYPSGGNYWSDYTGEDNYRGENQDLPGSDGIGDTPYYIPGDNNRDRYPLMNLWSPIIRGVEVSISPPYQSGPPGATLSHSVTVKNTGDVEDNYDLTVSDNAGWGLTLDDNVLEVPAGENRQTTLSVIIPENAVPSTEDNITVTATSQADNTVSDNDSCIARVQVVWIGWIKQFGTSDSDGAEGGVAVDTSGNIYVAGYTGGTLPGQTSAGGSDAFVRKYDSMGNEVWTRQFGTSTTDYAGGVAVDGLGNAYVAGYTWGALPGQVSAGWADAFVRKYDSMGNEVWTRQFGTSTIDRVEGVAVDGLGNVYVTGFTQGALPGQVKLGYVDAFVRKYDGSGNELWTRQFGSSNDDEAEGVAVDNWGNVYVAGWTEGALPGQASSGGVDAFVRKYDGSGNELWTRQFGSSDWDYAGGVAVDGLGNAYVAGFTQGALPGQVKLGYVDAFVRKYDSMGNEVWTRQFGSSDWDYAYDVAVDGLGNAYVAGGTMGALPGQSSAGGYDAFLVKFVQPSPPPPPGIEWNASITATFSGGSDDAIFGVRPDATDNFDNVYDIPEPPALPEPPYVRAYFHYPEQTPDKLHRSCLAPENLMEWPLRVEYAEGSEDITLTWNVEDVPADYSVFLYRGENLVADMRTEENYTFEASTGSYDFRIIVGKLLPFTLELTLGWNMISFPVLLENMSPDSIFDGYYVLYSWDAENKRYVLHADSGNFIEPDPDVEAGVGYWAYVLEDENVDLLGVPVNQLTLSLHQGWNLIGSPYGGSSIADPADDPDNSVIPWAFTWNAEERSYSMTQLLEAGKGYWAYALRDCTLTLLPSGMVKILQVTANAEANSHDVYPFLIGWDHTLTVGYYNSINRAFLKFDLSEIPSGKRIIGAKLLLALDSLWGVPDPTSIEVRCHEVDDDSWSGRVILWDEQPTIGAELDSVTIYPSGGWYSWDVTSFVDSQHISDQIVSFCLESDDASNALCELVAKEMPSSEYIPFLSVTYVSA